MSRTRSRKSEYERNYPFKVTIPTPPGGLGSKLNDMHAWCRENVADWQSFGATFYFKSEEDAALFRSRFLAYS